MKSVLVSVPNTGWIHKAVFTPLFKILNDTRYNVKVIMPSWNPYEHNMNRIANDVISGGYDYWLNIDSDNPPLENPLNLIESNFDIVGLPTPQWHFKDEGDYPIYWVAVDSVPEGFKEHKDKTGVQKVDAVGSGCMLVASRVIKSMVHPIFERMWNDKGEVEVGVDFNFCLKARTLGYEVYAHYDYPCRHFKEIELTETLRAFHNV